MIKISESARKQLKKPLGKLIKNKELKAFLQKISGKEIVAVGDVTSSVLVSSGILPRIIVYDNKEMRQRKSFPKIKSFSAKNFFIKNPAGHINPVAFKIFHEALKERKAKRKAKIKVQGEEDLLTLVAILQCPISMLVCYGQPGKGIVFVKVDKNIKKKIIKILSC